MTNSDQNISKTSDSAEAQFLQEISIPKHISQQANDLFAKKAKRQDDFIFNDAEKYEDIDDLADTLFEALHDHTNK